MDYRIPVANGIRTDHPYPNRPFVDDAHIPVDQPHEIESIGRVDESEMWGRSDEAENGEWIAYTTDPHNHAYAWVVRRHPEHGRSVLLYRDHDASSVYHSWWEDRPLLTRSGGHWWDGTAWYRPPQILDWASECHARYRVSRPVTLTAEDLLDGRCSPSRGRVHRVKPFEPFDVNDEQWRHDLAAWAEQQCTRTEALPLDRCVVTLNAPELSPNSLLDVEDTAREAGRDPEILRRELARGDADAPPPPQDTVDGQSRWSHAVVRDWIERCRRDTPESLLTGDDSGSSPGLRAFAQRTASNFAEILRRRRSNNPGFPRRLLQELMGEGHTAPFPHGDAEDLAWTAAANFHDSLPTHDIAHVIERAVLEELSTAPTPPGGVNKYDLLDPTGRMLVWFAWQFPGRVTGLFGDIIRDADTKLGIPRETTVNTLRSTVLFEADGRLGDREAMKHFLTACLPPSWEE